MTPPGEDGRPFFAPDKLLELLLQAFLCDRERGAEAFARWDAAIDFDDVPHSHFRQMGELADAVDAVAPGYRHRKRLQGLKKYVWSNNIHVLRLCLPLVDELLAAGVPFLVLKGGGVIAADPAALHKRFIRDLDLMASEAEIPRAAAILFRNGWRATTGRIPGRIRAQPFDKRIRGNPHGKDRAEIDMHRAALHFGRNGRFDEVFHGRSLEGDLMGRQVRYPHPVDRALIAMMHGLIHDGDGTFAWIVDAVRAMRDPRFDWPELARQVRTRRLERHAGLVLTYLQDRFDVAMPDGYLALIGDGRFAALFDAELTAISAHPMARGLFGRAAMAAAELLRSASLGPRVPFRTDYGLRMRKVTRGGSIPGEWPPNRLFRIEPPPGQGGRAAVEVAIRDPRSGRTDLDLWHDDIWLARLKIKPGLAWRGNMSGIWRATFQPLDGRPLGDLRVVLAEPADGGH